MLTTVNTVLQRAGYTNTTTTIYRNAVHSFLAWTHSQHVDIMSLSQLDMVLNEYIVQLYYSGHGKASAVKTVYGVIMYMADAEGHLPHTMKSLKGWTRLQPAVSYPPLSWDMCVLIACQLARAGYHTHGVACLLSFDCYLRVGELCAIQHSDVADVGDARLGRSTRRMCIRLAHTKTGPNKWVTVRNKVVIALLRSLLSTSRRGDRPLFPFSSARFRDVFQSACVALGISHVGYVPHSLRHGGATHDHLCDMPIEDIMLHGRWSSNKSARMYIQTGRSLLLTQSIPTPVLQLASLLSRDVASSMHIAKQQARH